MVLAMTRPRKHPKTGIYEFRKRVPERLRPLLGKTEVKRSLGTKDPRIARDRHAAVAAEIEAQWSRLEAGPQPAPADAPPLTHKQVVALSGEFYRRAVASHEDDPGDPSWWAGLATGHWRDPPPVQDRPGQFLPNDATRRITYDVRRFLAQQQLAIAPGDVPRIVEEVGRALTLAFSRLHRNATGDYSPDPNALRFPDWNQVGPKPPRKAEFTEIWARYVEEAKPKPGTVKRWKPVLDRFFAHANTTDLGRITKNDVIAWKDALVEAGLSGSTIGKVHLTALKTVCAWALANNRIDTDPSAGVKIAKQRMVKVREKGFTLDEAETILKATLAPSGKRMPKEHRAARRWIPWLCAYTGARVNEMTQLRKESVFLKRAQGQGEVWMIRIADTKSSAFRDVPIHPHLHEQGFLEFVDSCDPGPLFYSETRSRGGTEPGNVHVGGKLAKWVRSLGVSDPNVDPNHGWRHRFKSLARACDMREEVYDAIQGHAPASVSRGYGDLWPIVMKREIEKIPRYEIAGLGIAGGPTPASKALAVPKPQ
jgi:integrase